MIRRFSSIRAEKNGKSLGNSFLNERLKHATRYDRIAGFFSPSILQVAGEEIEAIEQVRIVANSKISFSTVGLAKEVSPDAFKSSLWTEWRSERVVEKDVPITTLERLYRLLEQKRMQVRILPDDNFGLIHGKAGVITLRDGTQTSFMGSANESISAWKLNYELVWEDTSAEAIQWVQEEFDLLWNDSSAFPLTRDIIEDILRTAKRKIFSIEEWKARPEPAAPVIEGPVYNNDQGLWNHQKYFVQRAFDEHRKYNGARLILADQVGLGKTIQLALSAVLMALSSEKPVLIVVPRTILTQWQGELWNLLGAPSAYWNGKCWIDETGIEHADDGPFAIRSCPRRIGLISQGLIFRRSKALEGIKAGSYECVIVDEAHRGRRRKLGQTLTRAAEGNNLLQFIRDISLKTKSLLLATATPVQMHIVEAWDLLEAIGWGRDDVIGDRFSPWADPQRAIDAIQGQVRLTDDREFWQWLRNPLPPGEEHSSLMQQPFAQLRLTLKLETESFAKVEDYDRLTPSDRARIKELRSTYFQNHNPFIRKIVRRTRKHLEETIDPETGVPYLQKVEVALFGESPDEAITLPDYLQDAYEAASRFCTALGKKKKGGGFLETLLLRRIGSSMVAGKKTALVLLKKGLLEGELPDDSSEEEEDPEVETVTSAERLESPELAELSQIIKSLELNQAGDPKVKKVYELLTKGIGGTEGWLQRGCIVFSQYFDSASWLAEELSKSIPEQMIGLYAGSGKSKLFTAGFSRNVDQDFLKEEVHLGKLKLLVGTDAASEGLNLQTLGALINLDLPWNPTRLEQRKGRIQRIGQKYSEVYVYNMRYRGSVEDNVHQALSDRLQDIFALFGQVPDTLSDTWVDIAFGRMEDARKRISDVSSRSPFGIKYNSGVAISRDRWERCTSVLEGREVKSALSRGW